MTAAPVSLKEQQAELNAESENKIAEAVRVEIAKLVQLISLHQANIDNIRVNIRTCKAKRKAHERLLAKLEAKP